MQYRSIEKSIKFFRIVFLGLFLSIVYAFFENGFKNRFSTINILLLGFLIGSGIAFFELFFFKIIRKLLFISILFIRTFYYLFLVTSFIFFEVAIARMIKDDFTFSELLQNQEFQNYLMNEDFKIGILYALVLIVIFNFSNQLNRKMGKGTMLSFITGKYAHPKIVERVFMFVRIIDPDIIVQKIGHVKFHNLINDLLFDCTDPIGQNKGRIYEYVDDEVVITWKSNIGIKNANCVRLFFDLKNAIEEKKEKYYNKYGVIPKFNAALHYGNVLRGEIGDVKCEIVYSGDVMNTTSRILDMCKGLSSDLLISAHLMYRIKLPVIYKNKSCGKIKLKGKEENVEIFTIQETQ